MAAWKRKGKAIQRFGVKLIEGMRARGYSTEFAERCFEQIKGFSEYGFPESHAASFAILVYVSCYLKHYHPAAFAAGLINSQPMGFYAPAQIIRDAQAHGVVVHPVDVNHSRWACTLERGPGGRADIRLGMRLVKGMQESEATMIAQAVEERGRFTTVRDLWRASGVSSTSLRRLAQADAFLSMGLNRQQALWAIKPLRDEHLPLFDALPAEAEEIELPAIKPGRQVLHDYQSVGLSLKAHPISFLRSRLETDGVTPCEDLRSIRLCPQGRVVTVAGMVLVRQRPGTASGVVFITLEDETGIANLILWSDTFERLRKVARLSTALAATGRVERQGEVVHVHVSDLASLDELLPDLDSHSRDFR
jgi:error-prone DNA polymerase